MFNMIDATAQIIHSTISEESSVYRFARVKESSLAEHTVAGDLTRIDYSRLAPYARADRVNHIYHSLLGRHTYTGPYTVIMHADIGNFSSISWGVTIGGADHDYTKLTTHSFLYNPYDGLRPREEPPAYDRFSTPCQIGNDVWIGADSCIVRNVSVGNGAVIGAGSVVTRNVPPYAIVAGNPARILKYRFSPEVIEEIERMAWWNWDDDKIRENYALFRDWQGKDQSTER